MTEPKLFIPVLLGTPRKKRESQDVAEWVCSQLRQREEIETQLFDVCDFKLPHDHYGQEIKDQFPEWRDAIIRADGLVIVHARIQPRLSGFAKGRSRPAAAGVHSQGCSVL
jgi:NAD(P)H-dependent FMN reductase